MADRRGEGGGFKQSSETFMLDGIPHIQMTWTKG
jgi:ElaA protein